MGIAFSFLPFFDGCHRRQALNSPLLALGSLEIHESEERILSFGRENGYPNLLRDKSVRSLFLDRYGIKQYQDLDINDKADILCDLNFPINQELAGMSSTILDGGTLEHVFDIRQALINIHDMLRVGGTIIHISPLTWFNHAFYNFNPKLYRNLIESNDYELIVEAYCIPQSKRIYFKKKSDQQVYIIFDGQEHHEVRKVVEKQLNNNYLPADSLYMIAYKKEGNKPFNNPYDK
jgi:hypothetical protein